jgi:hypothetical protein
MRHRASTPRARRWAASLVLAVAGACGRDAASPAAESVASVVVGGAPPAPVLVGSTVQLIATPLNASGVTMPGQTVTWQTSAPAVATVSPGGLVTAVGPGGVTITATGRGGGSGATSLDVRAGGPLGPDGGTLALLGGAVTVVAPPSALPQTTTLLLRPAVAAPAEPRLVPGTAFELGPETLAFARSATLTLRYDPARVPAAAVEAGLQLYVRGGDRWSLLRGSTVNTANRTVTGSIVRGGTYAVVSTPVERIALRGALVGGAMYVGQTTRLTAALTDANGDTLRARPVAWVSSDPQRVTVDGEGTATAVSPGVATITAASDGTSVATTVTVLAPPTADWTRPGEWTTSQGNARHTGHVPATLDPRVFRERWVATVSTGAINPPVTGDGKVFVSTTAYFGRQLLATLDGATGTTLWSRDFGGIHSVDPPAYGNGRVYVMTGGHGDSFLWAFEPTDGTVRFRTSYGNQWHTWGAPVVVDGGVYTAGGYYGGMYRFDAQSGAQSYFRDAVWSEMWSPAVRDGLVYVPYRGLTALEAPTGAVAFSIGDSRIPVLTPVLGDQDDALYGAGPLLAVDLGRRAVRWEQAGSFRGYPAVAGGVVYAATDAQVEARRESDGTLLWAWVPPEGVPTGALVLTDNLLFVATAGTTYPYTPTATYAVDLASRKAVWAYPAGGHLALSGQGILLVARSDGKVAAITVR